MYFVYARIYTRWVLHFINYIFADSMHVCVISFYVIITKTYNDVMIWYDNIQNISFYRVFVSFFGYFCNLEIWHYVNYGIMMKMPFYKSTKGRDMAKKNISMTYVMRCFLIYIPIITGYLDAVKVCFDFMN